MVNKNAKRIQKQATPQLNQIIDTNRPIINPVISILSSDVTAPKNDGPHSTVDGQIRPPAQLFNFTNESTRFALTRYLFSPFVVHFKSTKVTVDQVKDD